MKSMCWILHVFYIIFFVQTWIHVYIDIYDFLILYTRILLKSSSINFAGYLICSACLIIDWYLAQFHQANIGLRFISTPSQSLINPQTQFD